MERVLRAGVDVVRLNLSHGGIEYHLEVLERVRSIARKLGRPVGVLVDLPGPKIRTGPFSDDGVLLDAGDKVQLRTGDAPCSAGVVYIDYPSLISDLAVGDLVVLGDGAISLRCEEIDESCAYAVIETGGRTQGRPGAHLPSEHVRLSTPTDEDLVLAQRVAAAGVEFVAVSFVRTAADVEKVRAVVGDRTELVAKIETRAALDNLTEILRVSDAIMVARGDLGIDCPLEDVPHLQKSIVRQCIEYGVPVITATQILESMVLAPTPTRAEVSDVANAIFDGTDALMLSGETAIGHDPALTVATMGTIAERAEREASYRQWAARLGRVQREHWDTVGDRVTAALTHAASEAVVDSGAAAILCCTGSGRTARSMARFRPEAKLIALSPSERTVNALTLSWGVDPIRVGMHTSTDEIVDSAVSATLETGRIVTGDTVVVLAGSPDRDSSTAADVLRIVQIKQ
jgi:pyruvate kinase